VSALEGCGCSASDRRASTSAIVEGFDVFERGVPEFVARAPSVFVNELGLERREEALSNNIVPAIAGSAHAHGDASFGECRAMLGTRVLAAVVRMAK
jgi:hypothetical protein